jgi:menaquinone-specific isochorismate synthase
MPSRRAASTLSLEEPRQRSALQDWVDRALAEGLSDARRMGEATLHVVSRRVDWPLPLGVFDSPVQDVHFFGGPERAVLGVGVAKAFELGQPGRAGRRPRTALLALGSLSASDASKVSLIGGWGFPSAHGRRKGGPWRDFPLSRWVVPALTLTSSGRETNLTVVADVAPDSKEAPMRAEYRALAKELQPRAAKTRTESLPALKSSKSTPTRASWVSVARQAIGSISRDELKKVVLARAVALTFRGKVPSSVVLKRLIAFNPDSTVFAVKRRESVFLGATPESILSYRGGEVGVDCLAASSPRSADRETDYMLGTRLLRDPKSTREHQFVVRAAVSALSTISSRMEVPGAPVIKKLTTIQHLYTPVKATLLEREDVWAAAKALWPSPAIGGEPKDAAVRWIQKFERLDRGWYSGVVGLMDARQRDADMVVGIRSGVITGRRAVIYAGAGLVAGSVPKDEFEETGWKLRVMRRALGVEADGR